MVRVPIFPCHLHFLEPLLCSIGPRLVAVDELVVIVRVH